MTLTHSLGSHSDEYRQRYSDALYFFNIKDVLIICACVSGVGAVQKKKEITPHSIAALSRRTCVEDCCFPVSFCDFIFRITTLNPVFIS